jgi:outer membrane murein-binding lipoprotein Lpp
LKKLVLLILIVFTSVLFLGGCGDDEASVVELRAEVKNLKYQIELLEQERTAAQVAQIEEDLIRSIATEVAEGKISSLKTEMAEARLSALEILVADLQRQISGALKNVSENQNPLPSSILSPTFVGQVYRGENFNEYVGVLSDSYPIDFNWGTSGPFGLKDNFSIRWVGSVYIPISGVTTFYIKSDDGIRLWIDEGLILNEWTPQDSKSHEVELSLTKGWHNLKLEYFERTGRANICFDWFKK